MKKYLSIIAGVVFIYSLNNQSVIAQESSAQLNLEIEWHFYQNNYLSKEQNLWSFSLRNQSKTVFPKTGWKIYFNYGKRISAVPGIEYLKVTHVNGGLFYISPGNDYQALLANGQQVEQKFAGNSWVVNKSDAPQGFYLVWDNQPDKPVSLPDIKINIDPAPSAIQRFSGDKELTSAQLYLLNQRAVSNSGARSRIFPKPVEYRETSGYFRIEANVNIISGGKYDPEARLFAEELQSSFGKEAIVSTKAPKGSRITLTNDPGMLPGGYRLSVSPTGISISASDQNGMHYAFQSLKMLIEPESWKKSLGNKPLLIKCVEVSDHPGFKFRGVMLDVARNFQPKEEVFKLLDLLSLYKFNTLHLHLNDDEGWRIAIQQLPELTTVGSNRGHDLSEQKSLMPSYGSGAFAGKSSGSGFYSQTDFIEILKYAARRHINIIPEIETPGHARAAIVSMQARYHRFLKTGDTLHAREYLLRDFADSSVYRSVQQWNDHVMDVSMPSVYRFLETVTDEIIGMYRTAGAPLQTIHFGGDEVPVGVWTKSPAVTHFKISHPEIKTQSDLWDYYFARISTMLKQRKLYLSGWEETALTKTSVPGEKKWQPNPAFLDQDFHVNVWNNMSGNEDLAYRLANSGYKVVLSFVTNFYFDMAYKRQIDEPGFNWGGFINTEQAFKFIPFDYLRNQHTDYINRPLSKLMLSGFEPLTDKGKANIEGIQGLLWTETVKSTERLEYMYLPRLLALAERAWVKSPDWVNTTNPAEADSLYQRDWARFVWSASRELRRLDYYSGGFQYRIPEPAIMTKNGMVNVNTDLPGFQIRYTADGRIPGNKSDVYVKPIKMAKGLRFRAFNGLGRGGNIVDYDMINNGNN